MYVEAPSKDAKEVKSANAAFLLPIYILGNGKKLIIGVPTVVQQVNDLALSLWQCGFNPQPGTEG